MARKRLAFSGVYNTRPGGVQVLSASSGVVGIGIVGVMVVGRGGDVGSFKDYRLLNCLPVTQADALTKSSRIYIVNRPGFADSSTPAAGSIGTAIHVWAGQGSGDKVMSCFGGTNSTLYDGTTSKGTISGKARGITETSISGTATLAIASTDNTGWYYQNGGSATEITDSDWPGDSRTMVGNFAHMDGYAFIMDSTGRIYNSDVNSITSWTAGAFITANAIPDVGIGVVHHRNTIVAFCRQHIETLRNAGNPSGSPLAKAEELTHRVGCVNSDAITETADVIYFAGGTEGHVGIYSYNAGTLTKLSPPELDMALTVAGASNISLTSLSFYGRHFVVIIALTSTFVYCIEERNWHEWVGNVQLWYKASGVTVAGTVVNYTVSNDSTSGKVYILNSAATTYQDSGSTLSWSIQTPNWDDGTYLRKRFNRVGVVGDMNGYVPPEGDEIGDSGDTTAIFISWYDDDYQNASTGRAVTLAAKKQELTRCGTARRRAFVISGSANVATRLEALELDYELLSV